MATTEPKHHRGRIEVAYTIGLVRTRITACHSPSPGNAGRSCDERSDGFAGIVVVVVVVVVVASGTVVVVVVVVVDVDVVVVDVVVEVTTVALVVSMGQDEVATVGRICSGVMMSGTDVVVDDWPGEGITVVEVCVGASVMGVMARASESAGATAGGSLCSHASSLSTIGPILFSRAHDAMFCCNGSRG